MIASIDTPPDKAEEILQDIGEEAAHLQHIAENYSIDKLENEKGWDKNEQLTDRGYTWIEPTLEAIQSLEENGHLPVELQELREEVYQEIQNQIKLTSDEDPIFIP